VRNSRNLLVLLGYTFLCVYHKQCHITALYRSHSADYAVSLYIFIDFALASYAGRVYKYILFSVHRKRRIYRVPRRSRYRRYDNPVFTKDFIYERRFPNIRLADYGNLRNIIIVITFIIRKCFHNFIENISKIEHIDR